MDSSDILRYIVYILITAVFVGVCILIYVVLNKKKGTDKSNQYLITDEEPGKQPGTVNSNQYLTADNFKWLTEK